MYSEPTCNRIVHKGQEQIEDIEKIRESLEKQGCEFHDIETAIDLMSCVVFFDKKIFPENPIESLYFDPVRGSGHLAVYNFPGEDPKFPKGLYQVRVKGLYKELSEWKVTVLFCNNDGGQIIWEVPATLEEKVAMIAAHEVRHRVQDSNKSVVLDAYNIYDDPQVNHYVIAMRKVMEKDPEAFYAGYEGEKKEREFDARTIERFFLGELNDGADEERLCGIIRMEPYSVGFLQRP